MLRTLKISNLVLIEELEIDFTVGFTVLTGETGAGKSIILDALLLVLGERASAKLLKDPTRDAEVTAIFSDVSKPMLDSLLEDLGIGKKDELILRRVLLTDGRSKAYLNDTLVTNHTLNILRENLLEICGQHESRGLGNSSKHIKLLDESASYQESLQEVKTAFINWQQANEVYNALLSKKDATHIEQHYLQSVIKDLQELNFQSGEESALLEKRQILINEGKLKELIEKSGTYLEQDLILSKLYSLEKELSKFSDIFHPATEALARGLVELEEFYSQITNVGKAISETQNLNEIEDRLFNIRNVSRKYNINLEHIQEFLTLKKCELEALENFEDILSGAIDNLTYLRKSFIEKAQHLSTLRLNAAQMFRENVLMHLRDLKMDAADFKVEITTSLEPRDWSKSGMDSVKFLVKTNPDCAMGALSKIASGGELSRIMLAIKMVLANINEEATLVFDEIDTGISGAVATAVGKKLAALAKGFQILAVTHQPQVTASADIHLLVQKYVHDGKTKVTVRPLAFEEKLHEIARMISGEQVTKESILAAQILVKSAA